jgi:hypothetical protein
MQSGQSQFIFWERKENVIFWEFTRFSEQVCFANKFNLSSKRVLIAKFLIQILFWIWTLFHKESCSLSSNLLACKILEFLEQHNGGFPHLEFGSIWKILNQLLMGWGRYSVPVKATRVAPLSNISPGPTQQPPRAGETRCAPPVHRSGSTPAPVPDPRGPPRPSLLPPPIRGGSGRKYLPTFAISSSTLRWAPQPALCELVDDWLDHLPVPLVGLILIPSRSFCPRFHDHRARAPASTAPLTTDLHSMLVSSCSCASRCQWGMDEFLWWSSAA